MNQSLASNEDLLTDNIRYSGSFSSISPLGTHVRYSRHLSFAPERIFSNGRSRIVIHTSIRTPTNDRRTQENYTIDPDHHLNSLSTISVDEYSENNINDMDTDRIIHSGRRFMNGSDGYSQNQLMSQSIPDGFYMNNNSITFFHEQINKNDNAGGQYYWPYGNRKREKERSNINDLLEDPREKKKKREKNIGGYLCSCSCLLTSLLAALLLATAITMALLITLFKPQTTTTTTTSAISTVVSTTITTTNTASTTVTTITSTSTATSTTVGSTASSTTNVIITSTTETITTTTTTDSTTSVSTTLTTTTACSTMSSTAASYSPSGSSYTHGTYTYIASSTGTALLEFAFSSNGNGKVGYLDDVSMVDTNASNSEILINGGFENGSLIGWQVICPTQCSGSSGSLLSSSSLCNTGSFCYHDSCKGSYDMLRQIFQTTAGHVYTLSFWMKIDTSQDGFFRIV